MEGEGVTAVHFADSFPGKNNFDLSKCLYIGTSLGSVLVIVIVVPEADTRWRDVEKEWRRLNLTIAPPAHWPGGQARQNTISHISHQGRSTNGGRGIKNCKFSHQEGSSGYILHSIWCRASGRRAPADWQKCFPVFCLQLSDLFDLSNYLTTLRESESVVVSPSGSLLRLKSTILEFCLLDSSFALAERWRPLYLYILLPL